MKYDSKYQQDGSFMLRLFGATKLDQILKKVDMLKIEVLYRYGGVAMDADQVGASLTYTT